MADNIRLGIYLGSGFRTNSRTCRKRQRNEPATKIMAETEAGSSKPGTVERPLVSLRHVAS